MANVQIPVGLWWKTETKTTVCNQFVLLENLWSVQLLLDETRFDVVDFVPELVLFHCQSLKILSICRTTLNFSVQFIRLDKKVNFFVDQLAVDFGKYLPILFAHIVQILIDKLTFFISKIFFNLSLELFIFVFQLFQKGFNLFSPN
jgi:hypothetical protein